MLNEPTVTEMDPEEALRSMLQGINDVLCRDIEGNVIEIIDDLAKKNLSIRRGSLNEEERKEIESHVIHTYNFVSKIPWPPEFKNIPEIALKHHEKLDGTGYPSGLRGEEIPIQARMMAIADIYDALTASDRPYKKAISKEMAIKILGDEEKGNKIDPDLFELFVRYKIFDAVDRDFYRTT
jgi:HD-GYP domain-containing protein (c-di-GMP phosphodiesterase class II)